MPTSSNDPALERWAERQESVLTGDPVWRLLCYREALFLLTLTRGDSSIIVRRPELADVAPQLLKAAGSIPANISEGYGRPTTADRIRFLSYALGSVREVIAWYESARTALDDAALKDRFDRLTRIRRMLLGLLSRLRGKTRRAFDPW